jgi:serine/threonine-protein kinase
MFLAGRRMTVAIGARIGSYEVLAPLGVGGMGEVYRARDAKLNRDVALKILPSQFALDPERLARFKREAQVLASLDHPNIGAIYGFEDADGVHALVLQLVEGPTLADRIAQGPVPIEEALPIAKQIAEALEAAHEQGIVHRDLKPANIKVRPDGAVKVLDFGLAKLAEPPGASAGGLSQSPTITTPAMMTGVGMILGTAAYMSPEQARGRAVDKRADVWAFGAVLFEMIGGRPAFEGELVSDVLASVLKMEPNWRALPAATPSALSLMLRRCLEKDPRRRLQAIGEARVQIEDVISGANDGSGTASAGAAPPMALRPFWRRALLIAATAIAAVAVTIATGWMLRPLPPLPTVTRFAFTLPPGQLFTVRNRRVLDISPDGTDIVYAANNGLYLRRMADFQPTILIGSDTDPGVAPVFSPDGRWVAFLGGRGMIKKVPRAGGAAVTLYQPELAPFGLNWGRDGIVFGSGGLGLRRVAENGGSPELLLPVELGETALFPQMLPGGNAVLFTRGTTDFSSYESNEIVAYSLKSHTLERVISRGSDARYVPTGHVVYAVGGVLFAVRFDPDTLKAIGEAAPVVEGILRDVGSGGGGAAAGGGGAAHFSISNTGSLVYVPGPASLISPQRDLAFFDRNGSVEPLKLSPALYEAPRVSPNGKQVALGTFNGKEANVWIYDLAGGSAVRQLTFRGRNRFPIWSADGERVAFQSDREGDVAIFWQRADGSREAERLTKPEPGVSQIPDSWSPSGDRFLFSETKDGSVTSRIYSIADRKSIPFGDIKSVLPIDAAFSPDGRWVAYQSGEPGNNAVYVQPFPSTGSKYQVSKGNAHHPAWSRDGKEIVFNPATALPVVVKVTATPSFQVTEPVQLPAKGNEAGPASIRNYDIMPGGRMIGVVNAGQPRLGAPAVQQINVVLNWFEELKQRVPTR